MNECFINNFICHTSLNKQRMYYRSGTGVRCCAGAGQTLRGHSPGESTFLCEITSWPPS